MNKARDVAVIGMAGRFPGADNVSELWAKLCAGHQGIRDLSDESLRRAGVSEAELADPSYVKACAPLADADRFDPGFFKIAPREAELMDPQVRLLLQCAWETLEDAGYAGPGPQNIGVFAGAGGVVTSYFANFVNLHGRIEKISAGATHICNDKDFLSTYLSYKLNLTGPSMTVQTACSTSLVAVHQARMSLLNGECSMALAGGVSVRVPLEHGYRYREGYIFSKTGRIRAFDADADGVVFGSGLGLVLLKRLDEAVRDGDHIYAVIKGSAIGNDGKAKMSYAASSASGQIACIRAALDNAGVSADSIGLVETHGTGTAMGDPEEVKALSSAFKRDTERKGYCALGAAKANLGHLEAAAGVVGLIKAALAVQRGVIPPVVNYARPNPRIRFENTPFYVDAEARGWPEQDGPRRAAVNGLGVGGTNAFVVLEQHQPSRRVRKASGAAVAPISARTAESLRAYAGRLADFLGREAADLGDLAFTLQTGRQHMACRAAFVADTTEQLREQLQAYAAGHEPLAAAGAQGELAAAWMAGGDVDWSAARGKGKRLRVSLPTYVFARERYWLEAEARGDAGALLHPLLHANTSDLDEHRYSSLFSGEEFFLRDHQVRAMADGEASRVLPGVAYLEMARAAAERTGLAGSGWTLRDIAWLRPAVVDQPRRVNIALLPDGGGIAFEAYGEDDAAHCQGRAEAAAGEPPAKLDVAELEASLDGEARGADAVYAAFDAMGLAYGPAHRAIRALRRGENAALARLSLPASARDGAGEFLLHPSLLDGALQAASTLLFDLGAPPSAPIVPFALDLVRVWSACPTEETLAWARVNASGSLDIDLADADGNVCASLRGFAARALDGGRQGALLATEAWVRREAGETAFSGERIAVLCGLPDVDAGALGCETLALPMPDGDAAERYASLSLACFGLLRQRLAGKPERKTLLQFVLPDGDEPGLMAGMAGMLKTAALENPLLRGQLIFTDLAGGEAALAARLAADAGSPEQTLIRHAGGERMTAIWTVLNDAPQDGSAEAPFKAGGVYLITGGLGGLGMLFAREIARKAEGARIVLTGRAEEEDVAASADKSRLLAELAEAGCSAEYRRMDPADAERTREVVAAVARDYGRLNGVLHSAGMIDDGFVLKKTDDSFRAVLAPKVAGAFNLHRATLDLDLDFLALFSSLTSALGNLGQADYAAANGFLDRLAAYRNRLVEAGACRGRALAMLLPLWRDGGMAVSGQESQRLAEAMGIRPMASQTGMRLFARALAGGFGQALAMEGDLAAMRRALGEHAAPMETAAVAPGSASAPELASQAEAWLCGQLRALLKLDKVDPAAPLDAYGMDSILALDLTRHLEKSFGQLPKTLFFEYLNLRDLAAYFARAHAGSLARLLGGEAADESAVAPIAELAFFNARSLRRQGARRSSGEEPIAIIGLSGRYPGARDVGALWEALREGRDCITEVPRERWDWREYYSEDRSKPGAHYSKWGGFIEGVDEFDARFFNIAPPEADKMDPQERLFLEHAWMAVEDAGYTRARLRAPAGGKSGQVGVYAGVMYGEYQLLGAESSLLGQRMGFASNPASIANRVSYFLDLRGPSMVVDTMCSSSLTAIHLASQDLRLGRTGLAIAGGVNITIHPNKYLMLSAGQFISGDGHCQSFGEGGDGYIPGEGVGAVVLKRLSDAERDGDRIYGVIRGSALSHGGKTNGYTVPNPQAQAAAIRQAIEEAGVDVRNIGYIEAHGTGTKLGDPIEIAALAKAFGERAGDAGCCRIGSVKSNIGHCEAAAGIAGLTKVLLQMRHRSIAPSLHSSRLNPHIDFASTPFVVNQTLSAWDAPEENGRPLPRVAGISSFGAGGSNAHLVVEEHVPAVRAQAESVRAQLVPLSARTADQLRRKAIDLLAMLDKEADGADFPAIASTLRLGREPMAERLGVQAADAADLAAKLRAFVDHGRLEAGVFRGRAGTAAEPQAALSPEMSETQCARALELWTAGAETDWRALEPVFPPPVSLPAYPFARQRHWVDVPKGRIVARDSHPLLGENRSGFDGPRYVSAFSGEEPFLDGETGQRALGAAGCLEMARAAFEAVMNEGEAECLELSEVAWAVPGVGAEGRELAISLFERNGNSARFEIHHADGDEAVHCQGRLAFRPAEQAARLDLAALRAAAAGRLLPLPPAEGGHGSALRIARLDQALRAAAESAGVDKQPAWLAGARFSGAVELATHAWLRPAQGDRAGLDIDLCDDDGAVLAQLKGLAYPHASAVLAEAAVAEVAPRKVALALPTGPAGAPGKPLGIQLGEPIAAALASGSMAAMKPAVALGGSAAPAASLAQPEPLVDLYRHGDGVYELRIGAPNALSAACAAQLRAALDAAAADADAKALILSGTGTTFLQGGADAHAEALQAGLYRALLDFPVPVIAAMRGEALGAGFLLGALCDFMVCAEASSYGFIDFETGLHPGHARGLLEARFGRARAADLLYLVQRQKGERLRRKGWTCPVLPEADVEGHARRLAGDLARKPTQSLRLLKRHLARPLAEPALGLDAATVAARRKRAPEARLPAADFECLQLRGHPAGVLEASIRVLDGGIDIQALTGELARLVDLVNADDDCRSLALMSEHPGFLPLDGAPEDAAASQALMAELGRLERPLVAALDAGARGAAWLAALGADVCVYRTDGRYAMGGLLSDAAQAALRRHFDDEPAYRLLLDGGEYTGAELLGRFGATQACEPGKVAQGALALAANMAMLSREELSAWRAAGAQPPLAYEPAGEDDTVVAGPVALSSGAVKAVAHPNGVLEVRLEDRAAKNMFSDAFSAGLREAFAHVAASRAYKAVVLTGYDQYFSSGGTQETLLAIHEGSVRFNDNPIFRLPLDCEIPVIAAMQGHAIGAGWALGMFADFALLAEESRYYSPYMGYGFTPGAGATLVFPLEAGRDLALESLMTAREYSGADLARRGMPQQALPRGEVLAEALALAGRIARHPRSLLLACKRSRSAPLRRELDEAIARELEMHERTFVGQAGALARIQGGFGAGAAVDKAAPAAAPARDAGKVAERLRSLLAQELRMDEVEIVDDEPFVSLGLDSITGVTWIRRINEDYGTDIEAVRIYSYPTLAQLARHVAETAPAREEAPAAEDAPQFERIALRSRRSRSSKPAGRGGDAIAVVGMAGRFAGADDLDAFWRNLAEGRDCVEEVPAGRWDMSRHYQPGDAAPGKTYSKWMGALGGYDCFDPAFFNLSPREARSMDPQQRVFLETCWHGIEHAGYDPRKLSGSRCGVFVGCAAGDYHRLSEREQLSGPGFTGASPAILAARISYLLDLRGPSMAIDTACSSSLVAIASACDSLASGASDLALAGGVNVLAGPAMHIMTSQMGMLSPNGRCRTFDEAADGIAIGEGSGVVVLKRLADAERDGDRIYGVVQGWGVNQDGKTNGITAPSAEAQTRLQQDVYQRFGIDPSSIGLIEAHGTGTPLGDPIEVAALKDAFAPNARAQGFCALGSVKSNIGHCLSAAGISGFLKLLMALKHRQLPPAANFSRLNPHISLQGSPFYVNDKLRDWAAQDGQPRRAAINAFGFSGTNAHIVLAEHGQAENDSGWRGDALLPLSARTPEQLRELAGRLLAWLGENTADLARLAATLQLGRTEFGERLALLAGSADELAAGLRAFLNGDDTAGGRALRGKAGGKGALSGMGGDADFQAMAAKWMARRELGRLAELWAKGVALDWSRLYPNGAPRKLGLPLYPFARERYWLETEQAPVPAAVEPVRMPAPIPAKVAAAPAASAPDLLRCQLRASLAEVLMMRPDELDDSRSFTELGLDSILGVEWMKAISREHGVALSATRIYDYPNLKALAAFLHPQLAADSVPEAAPAAAHAVAAAVASAPERVDAAGLQQELKASLAEALLMQPGDIDAGRSFMELGLDSIIGVEWVKALNSRYGVSLSATRIYDYPDLKALAAYLAGQMGAAAGNAPAEAGFPFRQRRDDSLRDLYFHSADCEGDFAATGECAVSWRVSPESNVCLREHVVFGEHLLPTDAYVELVLSALRSHFDAPAVRLERIAIANPLLGKPGCERHARIVFRRSGDGLQFFVRSGDSLDTAGDSLHMQGFIAPAETAPMRLEDNGFSESATLNADEIPTNVGACYAPLRSLAFGEEAARGEIRVADHGYRFLASPFVLYGGLCTVINHAGHLAARHYGASDDQFLPHRIGAVSVAGALNDREYRCLARLRSRAFDAFEFDFVLLDAAGEAVASVEAISLRRVSAQALRGRESPSLPAVPAQTGYADKIAVIGMSCRYPGSPDADAFWRSLSQGVDSIGEIPDARWGERAAWFHPDPRHPGTSYSKWAGLLDGIDLFDPLFFGISPAEAELMDPQQRIFLEECWKTIESAGYAPGAMSGAGCGVYVGCASGDYGRVLRDAGRDGAGAAFMGTSSAILAARISYYLNLKGAAIAVDTACSSSLVAVHLACESIRNGENEMALAGGINLLTTPIGHVLTSQVGMPSKDGRCAAFDAEAGGIVFSEGCGVLLLKSLSRALADNDEILGVIEGSGVNQDGKTNGITAPSANAQERLLRQVYGRFGIDPRRIGYVEAHGTATPLGDPIEVDALSAVFRAAGAGTQACALGSVKSNIGHAGFSAGVAGMVKALLCLRHGKLVPSLHYRQPNPHIDFAASPFYVNTACRDWDSDAPRVAAVSSFGFSGTNAHVVISEYPQVDPAMSETSDSHAVVLSARGDGQLRQQAEALLAWLADGEADLARVAHTLQTGRDAMPRRAGFVAASAAQLRKQLAAYLAGRRMDGVHLSPAGLDEDTLSLFTADEDMRRLTGEWLARRNLPKLLSLWVRGVDLDWRALHQGGAPRKLALPTYPFARESHWVRPAAKAEANGGALHPLLHRNASNLNQQRYRSRFLGDESFLADHRVNGKPVLPAAAYLEMARAAVADALPPEESHLRLSLAHAVWSQPLAADGAVEVIVDLTSADDGAIEFEVRSEDGDGRETLHCRGMAVADAKTPPPRLDLEKLRAGMRRGELGPDELYPRFAAMGLAYGPSFQGIAALHLGDGEALAELRLPAGGPDCPLPPGMLDSALQGAIELIADRAGERGAWLPYALESMRVLKGCERGMFAWLRRVSVGAEGRLFKCDIDMCDRDGVVCVEMRGFSARPLGGDEQTRVAAIIARVLNNELSADQAVELTGLDL
ncbi:SDR family NAD(P)-dependent oxidoreductase [Chromobacterium vaccinii]|uniref:SDR family NAD(P)-dependent oxidoreductase n=1 Tax=Chromobacterium vaccinii TaxID=1108595 RepID=UPI001E3F4487|nr:SDR family NAD(P)-dependent oxidoreductase [Chromobacterium vaccinii]MCD4501533.1 SDR family NAD(P)-dependent oxidoreductase [Chromobacterium vaccinii]